MRPLQHAETPMAMLVVALQLGTFLELRLLGFSLQRYSQEAMHAGEEEVQYGPVYNCPLTQLLRTH